MSPWDLEPIDENRRPNSVDRLPVLPSEIVRTLYRPRPEDWGDDLETECDRISAALGQVMKLAESEPFASPVNPNLCPYPMDLSTIKKRLDNRFYRRKEAVLFDLSYVFTKAESNNIRSASIIKNLCLEIIGTRDAVDVPAMYQELLEKYELGEEENGPGTSGADAASTSNTRTRSRRLTTTHSHHGPPGNRQSHQSSRPVPSPHNSASASSGHPSGVRSIVSSPNDSHKLPGSGSVVSGNPSSGIQSKGNQSLPYTLKWINGMKNFECNVCRKTFNHMGALNRHVRTHTGERPFQCKICKKRFTQKVHLEKHFRIHTGERPFQCKICKKRFSRLDNFKDHLVIHTGEHPFSCHVCGISFNHSCHLKRHQLVHTGEKPHQCRTCKKRFNRMAHLNRHLQTHAGEKPLKCHLCRKSFTDTSSHQKHLRLHGEEKTTKYKPSSIEGRPPPDLNGSDVEGYYLSNNFFTFSVATKFKNVYSQQIWRTKTRK